MKIYKFHQEIHFYSKFLSGEICWGWRFSINVWLFEKINFEFGIYQRRKK